LTVKLYRVNAMKTDKSLERELRKLSNTKDRMYFSQGRWISYRVEIFEGGEWFHPEWMQSKGFGNVWDALESCIVGFPLGTARVVRMEFVTNSIIHRDEVPQHLFLNACAYLGKLKAVPLRKV
jgi:hypothetical protein